MKTIKNIILSVALLVAAMPVFAQQNKTTVQEIWDYYINESIKVEIYHEGNPNIADFAYAFAMAHWGMPLTNELSNYLSVDNYKSADVKEFVYDERAGYIRLLFADETREVQACYWRLPNGIRRIAFMLYDPSDPTPYPLLRFYDYNASKKEMYALVPMPVTEECNPTTVFYQLPRKGKDIEIIHGPTGFTGKYVYAGDEGFRFEGPDVLITDYADGDGDMDGEQGLLYCILSSDEDIPVYSEEGVVVYKIPAGIYNVRLKEPEEGTWRIVGYALDTEEEEYVIDTDYQGGLYLKSDNLVLYTIHYDGSAVVVYSMPDDSSKIVTSIPEETYVRPVGATEDYYWIHIRWGDNGEKHGWVQITKLCSNPYTTCS